jgi:hypothetical protein
MSQMDADEKMEQVEFDGRDGDDSGMKACAL